MKSIFAAMVAGALIAGVAPASAAGARGGTTGGVHIGGAHIGGTRVAPPPSVTDMRSRIPAPLPEPARPPTINGPLGPNGMPPMGNGLR